MSVPAVLPRGRAHVAALALACASGFAAAATPGTHFEHKDWSLDCDNTGTCRASGYQSETDDAPVSVLFKRAAGPGAPVEAQVRFGGYGEEANPPPGPVRMNVGGHAMGTVVDGKALAPAQVAALLKALAGTGDVTFAAGKMQWRLSGEGAAAVLLKMDDAQGRVGTPGALLRKGAKPEASVAGPAKPPVIQAVRVPPASKADLPLALKVLATIPANGDCMLGEVLDATDPEASGVALWRLGDGRVLVTSLCWRAAYNEGSGYWIARDRPPYDAKLVTALASGFVPELGEITSAQKGRGLGDCWSSSSWNWDGREFVHAEESTTGQCKLVAPGGAWQLPTLVSDVRKPR